MVTSVLLLFSACSCAPEDVSSTSLLAPSSGPDVASSSAPTAYQALDKSELEAAASCLAAYQITLYLSRDGSLAISGDLARMDEATLKGNCSTLYTPRIREQLHPFFERLDHSVVECLNEQGVDAVYDKGIAVPGDVDGEIVNQCLSWVYESVR